MVTHAHAHVTDNHTYMTHTHTCDGHTHTHTHRIANNTNQILKSVMLISDNQHKQKIQLRAMDVVLFGPPNGGTCMYSVCVHAC